MTKMNWDRVRMEEKGRTAPGIAADLDPLVVRRMANEQELIDARLDAGLRWNGEPQRSVCVKCDGVIFQPDPRSTPDGMVHPRACPKRPWKPRQR